MLENLEKNQIQCWNRFAEAIHKIDEGKSVEYFTAIAKEAITEYIDFAAQIAKSKQEVPTLNKVGKIIAAFVLILLPFFSFSQDTIHVKKVFLNGHAIKVKAGYIVHKNNTWEVNGKDVMLWAVKETDRPNFKPSIAKR